jgi:poly(3-hydroxybutyrate) depolymerase
MVKEGTTWASVDGKEFVVMHVIEQQGHTWVHYRENRRDEPREYSCYMESFLSRFRIIPE